MQLLIKVFLEQAGAEVEFCWNGLDASQTARNADHDVILMDIEMPKT